MRTTKIRRARGDKYTVVGDNLVRITAFEVLGRYRAVSHKHLLAKDLQFYGGDAGLVVYPLPKLSSLRLKKDVSSDAKDEMNDLLKAIEGINAFSVMYQSPKELSFLINLKKVDDLETILTISDLRLDIEDKYKIDIRIEYAGEEIYSIKTSQSATLR